MVIRNCFLFWVIAIIPFTPGRTQSLSVTESWAKALDTLEFHHLSEEVVERVKWNILDAIGIMIHNASLPELRPYLDRMAETGGSPESTVWGTGNRLPAETAAAANAFLVHGVETDDNDFRGNIKTTAISVPPALAVAEWKKSSGKDLLTSIAIAYTINGRLGAMAGEMMHFLGYMPTSFFGSAGSGAAAAYLLDLDTAQTTSAFGMALANAGGAFQYFYDQTEEKKVLVARTVRNGLESAILAQKGYTGARWILEGEAGIFHSPLFALEQQLHDPELKSKIRQGLFSLTLEMDRLEGALYSVPKFYSCSSSISPFLMALENYKRENSLQVEDIERFEISRDWEKASPFAEKIDRFVPPQTIMGAQLNMNYTIALFLHKGSAFLEDFSEADLQHPGILSLAAKGSYVELPDRSARIVLYFRDGKKVVLPVFISRGEQPEPLFAEQRLAKFRRLTAGRLSPSDQEKVISMVHTLEQVQDMSLWIEELTALYQN